MSESIQNSHTSVLPVYTRGLTGGQAHIVYLSTTTNVGQLITIRDIDGFLSTPQSIFVSTTAGVNIVDASDSSVTIQQGFGYLTLKAAAPNQWTIVNENSFHDPSQNYTLRATSYSTLNVTGDADIAQTLSTSGQFRVKTLTAFSTYQGNDTLYVSSLAVRTSVLGDTFQVAGQGMTITNSLRVNGNSEFVLAANFGDQVSVSSSLVAADAAFGSNFRFGPGILGVGGEFSTSYTTSITGAFSTGGAALFSTSARTTRSLFVSTLTTNTYQATTTIADSLLLSTAGTFQSRTDIPISDATYTGPTNPVVFTTLSTATPALVIDGGRAPFATTSTLQVTGTISSAALSQILFSTANILNANGSLTISSIAAGTANATGTSILAPGGGPVPVINANFTQASTIAVARSVTAGSTIQAATAVTPALNARTITFSSLNTGSSQLNAAQVTASSLLLSSGLVAPTLTTLSVPFATILNQNGTLTTSTLQTNEILLSNTLLRPQILRSPTASTFTFSTPLVAVSVAQISTAVALDATTSSIVITTIRLGEPITQNPADPYTTISTASGVSTNTRYEYTQGSGTFTQPLQIHASLDRVVNITLNNVSSQTSTCYFTANMTYRNDSSISGVAGLRIVNSGGASTILSFNANPYVPFQKLTLSNYPIDQGAVNSSNTYYLAGANTLSLPSTIREYPAIVAGGNGPAYLALNANGDAATWASVASPPFNVRTNGFAWNGSNLWITGGQSATLTSLAYSYNGSEWFSNYANGLFNGVRAVAWNGTIWVAAGFGGANSLGYSYDGLNWTGAGAQNIFTYEANAVAWNGQVWVAGGAGDNHSLGYSYNGIQWYGLGRQTFSDNVYGIAYAASTNTWVAVGGTGATQIAYSRTGLSWTPANTSTFVNATTYGYAVAWNGSQFLVGGDSNIAYSSDGINWTKVGVSSIISSVRAVTWSGSQWCIGGTYTTHAIATSSNATTWTGVTASTLFTTTYGLQSRVAIPIDLSENDLTIAGAKTLSYSVTPSQWNSKSLSVSTINGIAVGRDAIVAATAPNPVDPSGAFLVAATDFIYYSTDSGATWTSSGQSFFGLGGIAFNGSQWIMVGQNIPNAVRYSSNALTWTNATIPAGTGYYEKVAYGTGRWIAVGNATNKVITSTDGITWTTLPEAANINFGVNIVFSGGLWLLLAGGIGNPNSVQFSTDGLTWSRSVSASLNFNNQANDAAWNGNRWVMVGNGTSYVMYSDDGIAWTASSSAHSIISAAGGTPTSVATNGPTWVISYGKNTIPAAGIIYSTDNGVTWTDATSVNSLIFRIFSVIWNGTYFIGVGQTGAFSYSVVRSTDGITWVGAGVVPNGSPNDVACRVPFPILNGQTLLTSVDRGLSWRTTDFGAIFTQGRAVAWNGYLWVAVGDANTHAIAYSLDGITWTGVTGTSLATSFRVVAWDGGSWFVYGTGANTIATSADGINWSGQGAGTAPSECVAYNGSNLWVGGANVAVNGNTLLTSANGLTWTGQGATTFTSIVRAITYNGSNWAAVGGTNTALATSPNGTTWTANAVALDTASGVIWSGKRWVAVGTSTIATTAVSTLTATWSTIAVSSLSTNTKLASKFPLPYGFTDSNIMIAGSSNATNNLAISMNGLTWLSVPSVTAPIWTTSWNGRFWTIGLTAAPAIQILTSSLQLSTPTQTSFSLTATRGIAWGTALGLAVGEGTSQRHSAYTTDGGLSWTADRNNAAPFYFFDTRAYGIGFGGNLWVAVGQEGTLTQSRGIRYSANGINWSTPSTTAGRGILLGCAVAYYSSIWVIGGSTIAGTNDTLATSVNGVTWNYLSNTTFSIGAYGIAWGGSNFVAVGEGTNTLAYSPDGSNWTGLGTSIFSTRGHSVSWNGRYFVAVGEGTNTMAYSSNGINWTGVTGTPFNSMVGGGGISARIQLPILPTARAPATTFNAAKTFNWSLTGITLLSQTAVQKPAGGASAWDSRARSQESFTASAYLAFTPAQTSAAIMMGLSENPTSTTSFTALNYALSVTATGTLQIYELGTLIQTIGFYATTDVLKITYDGTTIRYFQNATLLRSVSRAVGAPLFLSSSFFTPGGQLADIEFHALYTLSPTPPAFSTSGFIAESRPGTDVDQFSPFYLTLTSNLLPSQWNFYLTLDGNATGSNSFYGDIYIGETKYASTNAVQATYTTSPSTYVLSFSTTTSIGISTPTYLSLRLKATRSAGDTFLYTAWSNAGGTDYRSSLGTQVSFNPNAIEYLQFFHSNANSGLQTSELDLYVTIGSTISTTYLNPSTGMEFNRGFLRWNTTLNGTTIENRFNDTTTRSLTYTGAIYNASDPKVKEGIIKAETSDLYATIRSLPLHRYSFIEPYLKKYGLRDRRQIGVLATEVRARLPAAVSEGPAPLEGLPAFQTIDRAQIQYAHVGATQALMARVSTLKSKIGAISAKR